MIKQLIKIIYMKITKPAPRLLSRADTGTGTGNPRARHVRVRGTGNITAGGDIRLPDENSTELSSLPPVTVNPDRIRELYERGLIRMEAFEAEREARQTEALLTHDPRHCPCSGRHYPSPSVCRWCSCHRISDPVTESAVRPSGEIELCGACGHPRHPLGERRCAFLVPPGLSLCPCVDPGPPQGPDSLAVTFDREHGDGTFPGEYLINDEAVDAAWNSFLGINPDESEDDPS